MISYASTTESLVELGQKQRQSYASAHPFPHAVIEDFFDPAVIEGVLGEASQVDKAASYAKFVGARTETNKFAYLPQVVGPETARLVNFLNSGPVIAYLEKLTGIDGLLADPSYFGGGLHCIEQGGFLEVHADFNHLKRYNLERRINLLLYLNKDWRDEYNGKLELWDRTTMAAEIAPVFNRCVIFSTTQDSLHGHPVPLKTPDGIARRSIALYYYTNTWSGDEQSRNTRYFLSPANTTKKKTSRVVRDFVLDFIPPILRKATRAIKRKIKGERLTEL